MHLPRGNASAWITSLPGPDSRRAGLTRRRRYRVLGPSLHAAKPLPVDGELLFLRFAEINHEATSPSPPNVASFGLFDYGGAIQN
jgi:hypothetical protein